MKWALCICGLLLLCACTASLPGDMSWKEYHLARHALHVVYSRADVVDCVDLGEVSGKSTNDPDAAKEKAISAAVLLKADHLLIDQIENDAASRSAYLSQEGQFVYVYGTAYRCGQCESCVIKRK